MPLAAKAERTLSPHDMNRQGLPLPSTPFNHRSVSQVWQTFKKRPKFIRFSCIQFTAH